MKPQDRLSELIQNILKGVEHEYEMGGLSSGLYGDYASDVARNVVIAVLQEQKAMVEGMKQYSPYTAPELIEKEGLAYDNALSDYKQRLEETIKEWEKLIT